MTMDDHTPAEYFTATTLLDRFKDTAVTRGGPVWLQWRRSADQIDAEEVAGRDGLLGRTVAPAWEGSAVIGTGRLRLLDEAHEPPAVLKSGFAGGLAMACAVSRSGGVGWRMRLPDGSFYDRVPEEGFMLDVLRRSLGLATPPPPTSIAPLELAAWFAAIAGRSLDEGHRLEWWDALALHPAMQQKSRTATDEPETLIRSHTSAEEWDVMRRLVAAGLATASTPPPELAEWMDAGMFSRWVLDGLPSLRDLLSFVRPHLESGAQARVAHLARVLDERAGAGIT